MWWWSQRVYNPQATHSANDTRPSIPPPLIYVSALDFLKIQQHRDELLKIQQHRDELLKIQQQREVRYSKSSKKPDLFKIQQEREMSYSKSSNRER